MKKKKHSSVYSNCEICLVHAHLIVISPRWYGELHGRHKSGQLQPSDVQLFVWQSMCFVYQT